MDSIHGAEGEIPHGRKEELFQNELFCKQGKSLLSDWKQHGNAKCESRTKWNKK